MAELNDKQKEKGKKEREKHFEIKLKSESISSNKGPAPFIFSTLVLAAIMYVLQTYSFDMWRYSMSIYGIQ
jgi:hypothetical protein